MPRPRRGPGEFMLVGRLETLWTPHRISPAPSGPEAGPTAALWGSAGRAGSCGRGGRSVRGVNGAEPRSTPQPRTPRTSRLKPGFILETLGPVRSAVPPRRGPPGLAETAAGSVGPAPAGARGVRRGGGGAEGRGARPTSGVGGRGRGARPRSRTEAGTRGVCRGRRGPPWPVRPGGVAVVGSIGQTGAPPPRSSRPAPGARGAGGAAGGWACDWPGWAGRVAGGAREPEPRGAGRGAEPARARSCPARRLLGPRCCARPGRSYGNFPATWRPCGPTTS